MRGDAAVDPHAANPFSVRHRHIALSLADDDDAADDDQTDDDKRKIFWHEVNLARAQKRKLRRDRTERVQLLSE